MRHRLRRLGASTREGAMVNYGEFRGHAAVIIDNRDSHEWRFLNKMGKPRMLISESKMHISETKDALRNRHSGQPPIKGSTNRWPSPITLDWMSSRMTVQGAARTGAQRKPKRAAAGAVF